MNIKIHRTGKIHSVDYEYQQGVWLRCGGGYPKTDYVKTTEPLTCKTCIKLENLAQCKRER